MDVYDVNEDLVKTLIKSKLIVLCSKQFSNLDGNHKKVNYVMHLLEKFDQFPKLELKVDMRVEKNNEKSIRLRKEGNEYFSLKNKDYFKALHLYNESICFAETDSENISIGYANRSAILFEWKLYKECLDNIKLAKEYNYPDRLMHKLEKREKECLELLHTQVAPEDHEFNISYEKNPQVPTIANCLELKYTEELGRHVCTNKSLKPGDIVAIEEPFCSALLPHMKYIRCANCKKENYLTLIPCPNCTSAMFCSTKCLEEGQEKFHKIECPIIDLLFSIFNKIHHIALRVSLEALSLFNNTEECMVFCNEPKNENQNAFTLDYENFSRKEYYRAIHGLVTNQKQRTVDDLFQRAVICSVLVKYLFSKTPLADIVAGENQRNFFINLLFRHLQTSPSNMHSVDLIEQPQEEKEDTCYASAAYAFCSMLNHSCAPNTVRVYKGTTANLLVLIPIPENGQLFDNYGYHFATAPKKVRQQNLQTQYLFNCRCDACIKDYPTFFQISTVPNVPDVIQEVDIQQLRSFSRKFALDNYEKYCEFLEKYTKFYPCYQLSAAEESLKMAYNILANNVPLKAIYRNF